MIQPPRTTLPVRVTEENVERLKHDLCDLLDDLQAGTGRTKEVLGRFDALAAELAAANELIARCRKFHSATEADRLTAEAALAVAQDALRLVRFYVTGESLTSDPSIRNLLEIIDRALAAPAGEETND